MSAFRTIKKEGFKPINYGSGFEFAVIQDGVQILSTGATVDEACKLAGLKYTDVEHQTQAGCTFEKPRSAQNRGEYYLYITDNKADYCEDVLNDLGVDILAVNVCPDSKIAFRAACNTVVSNDYRGVCYPATPEAVADYRNCATANHSQYGVIAMTPNQMKWLGLSEVPAKWDKK